MGAVYVRCAPGIFDIYFTTDVLVNFERAFVLITAIPIVSEIDQPNLKPLYLFIFPLELTLRGHRISSIGSAGRIVSSVRIGIVPINSGSDKK